MRLDLLSVALRERDPWEATDLGIALWRRHFAAILRPWLGLSLPVLVLVAAFAFGIGKPWLAWLLLWWLKPWFDRVPLYVLSRAVFGTVPGTRQVLRARELFAPGLGAWLSWRRLHPARALLLPVDLLEGVTGERRAARGAVLLRAVGAQAFGLIATCVALEFVCLFSLLSIGLLFLPTEFLSESARALRSTLFVSPPAWAQLLLLCLWWLSVSLLEPIYVAAGFGLYLHRRTQLEAWDIELVFRRLAARVREIAAAAAAFVAVALLCGSLAWSPAAQAAPGPAKPCAAPCRTPIALTPAQLLGDSARAPAPAFERALDRAYSDLSLARTRKFTHWVLRTPRDKQPEKEPLPPWLAALGWVLSAIAEYGLWIVAALLLLLLLWRLPRWLPWVRAQLREETPLPPVLEQAMSEPVALPDDVPAAVSSLWREGRQRDALALLYRASVVRLAERLGTAFPPGATEADCLRRARRLDDAAARDSFGEVVRTWQRAAYARQYPDAEHFDALVSAWSQRFPVAA
jgi:hypothetical protein